jgi:hypothetical protein
VTHAFPEQVQIINPSPMVATLLRELVRMAGSSELLFPGCDSLALDRALERLTPRAMQPI